MKTFIPNIDDANTRVEQLETELAAARQANARVDSAAEAARQSNAHGDTVEEAARQSNARIDGKGSVEPLKVFGLARAQAANAGHKTHIELSKTEPFGLQRAMAANAKQQEAAKSKA